MSAATAKTTDPSMEEILASIRRIIADDEDSDAKAVAPQKEEPAAGPPSEKMDDEGEHDDVLDLAAVSEAQAQAPGLDLAVPDLSFEEEEKPAKPDQPVPLAVQAEAPKVEFPLAAAAREMRRAPRAVAAPEPPPREAPARHAPPPPEAPSPQAVSASLEGIISHEATASVGQAFNLLSHTIMNQNANTLEDIVRDMLKPMLKTWLDDNLPPLVERLVAAEIQRVARGQR